MQWNSNRWFYPFNFIFMCISKCICYHNCYNKFFIMFSCCRRRLASSSLSWLLLNVFDITNRHLARNPFICDCNLRWLADYLHKNPIETSGARCDAPKRMHRRRIEALRDEKFKCKCRSFLQLSMNGECSPGDCEWEREGDTHSLIMCNRINWIESLMRLAKLTWSFLQVTMIIVHVMYHAVSIRNAQLHAIASAQPLIVRHEVLRKSHEIYHFIRPNCK